MRILWVKVGGLWPLDSGGRLRSFHILRELARRHPVTVLTTHGPGDEPQGLAAQVPEARVVSVPHAPPKQGSARRSGALMPARAELATKASRDALPVSHPASAACGAGRSDPVVP